MEGMHPSDVEPEVEDFVPNKKDIQIYQGALIVLMEVCEDWTDMVERIAKETPYTEAEIDEWLNEGRDEEYELAIHIENARINAKYGLR